MKKIISVAAILAMLFSLCACGTSGTIDEDEAQDFVDGIIADAEQVIKDAGLDDVTIGGADMGIVGLPNPMTEHDSLDELNDAIGCRLAKPPVMGVTGEQYFTIDCGDYTMADYRFEVNGTPFTFRCAPVMDRDISGIYVGDGTAFADEPGAENPEYRLEDGVQAARWFTIDGQYLLCTDETGIIDDETFKSIVGELYGLTGAGKSAGEYAEFYAGLAGMYADKNSQRAMAEVIANGSESVTIIVTWANGAACRDEWTMTARLMEDGLLSYTDLVQKELNFTSDTEYTEEIIECETDGWFEYIDGVLCWTGAASEDRAACEFEKYN